MKAGFMDSYWHRFHKAAKIQLAAVIDLMKDL